MIPPDLDRRIISIVQDVLMIEDAGRIKPDANFVRDLGAESLNIAELAVAVENEFGIVVDDDSVRKLTTVAAMRDYVAKALT